MFRAQILKSVPQGFSRAWDAAARPRSQQGLTHSPVRCVTTLALRKSEAARMLMSKLLSQDPRSHLSFRCLLCALGGRFSSGLTTSVHAVQRHRVERQEKRHGTGLRRDPHGFESLITQKMRILGKRVNSLKEKKMEMRPNLFHQALTQYPAQIEGR